MEIGDAEEDGGHDRRLADHHGVEARGVEVEEPLSPGDLDEESGAIDEKAATLPAMPQSQPPNQADRRAVSDCCCWHLHAIGVYPRPAAGASAPGLQRRKSAVSKASTARINDAQLGKDRRHSGLVHVPVLLRLARP